MTRLPTVLAVLAVLLLPFIWLQGLVTEYGVEERPLDYWSYAPERIVVGAVAGMFGGLLAGALADDPFRRALAVLATAVVAGFNSWGLMYIDAALTSTSGHGFALSVVTGTVWSWLLAFAAFFSAAWVVRRSRRGPRSPARPGPDAPWR